MQIIHRSGLHLVAGQLCVQGFHREPGYRPPGRPSPEWRWKGYLIESLGEDRWRFDNGSESSLEHPCPKGSGWPTGERVAAER